ncbi:MAG: SDR family oxidoreductase [Rhodobacter sp.]|nr:SDR family oxidoreductase [Rhodobacter sp.]MCA3458377.1 SDR family oxidoreductase [Rhodobacter sp.]MCA3462640.1 SDR family oxidoreductase [Rhodobacter sp.]MCA3463770.1 SDR family oxidoreductase [Rhodobacter sp.]MCA3469134.1 SDR family oxidoreductase [Rhodobacter sp.]
MFNLAPIPVPNLSGRSVLVTGATRGIGAALVRVLVAQGARVFAGVLGDPEALPGDATVFQLDVTRQADVDAAIARVRADAGRLDVLVNNAGIISPIGPLASLASDSLAPAFAVNVIGVHRMVVAALPLLRASQGTIVNAGTGAATTPMEGWTAYCTSKAGVHMLTRLMALELGPEGIQSFFIGIPPTDTAMQAEIRAAGLNPISKIPRDHLVPTAVPASVMAYLCSAEARGIDGVLLDVRQDRFKAMMPL